ncbi:MAG: 4-(cytidine 5'-diphospho)-2-C-methyl-D-erythritol kinase [Bryobacteraceae bacterium]
MTRHASIKSLAKINLDLRVLAKRPDGFHDLRTVFQTISLADTIDIEYEPSQKTELTLADDLAIPNNLILSAARAALHAMKLHASVRFALHKQIPMGAGLGGGSGNAASVLLALPVLAGRVLPLKTMLEIGGQLGSDVPFFLTGGTAMAMGRGTELYDLPDIAEEPVLLVSPAVHISTGAAYDALGRSLTFTPLSSSINSFQAFVRALGHERSAMAASPFSANDFETVVFRQYPQLRKIAQRLRSVGGVRMTGSGSTIFALFSSREERASAGTILDGDRVFRGCGLREAELVSRRSYQRMWRRQLREHLNPNEVLWPPRSRYEQ